MCPRPCATGTAWSAPASQCCHATERIAFEKALVAPRGQPLAAFVCPGHPLLDSVIDLTLERHRDLLERGTVLVDERDHGMQARMLFFLEHSIQDASLTRTGERRVVSRRMLYVEMGADGSTRHIRYAPYLDYRPLRSQSSRPTPPWMTTTASCRPSKVVMRLAR